MRDIFWVRHAPIIQNGVYTGQHDVNAIIPQHPANFNFPENAVWFSSPLKRAVQTTQWIGMTATIATPLQEQHFGVWEGKNYDDIWKEAEHLHDWSTPETVRPDGGESFVDVCMRVAEWLDNTLATSPHVPFVIVAHAGSIRAGLRHIKNLTYTEALAIEIHYLEVITTRY